MTEFVHLHNHTDFSLLDGAASISRYVAKAKEYGMKALAITDHGNMFGVLDFYDACKKAGIQPIRGVSSTSTLRAAPSRTQETIITT